MAALTKLKRFEINADGPDFTLHIEDERGQMLEVSATRDQIDVIADSLDDILLEDESGDEVDPKS